MNTPDYEQLEIPFPPSEEAGTYTVTIASGLAHDEQILRTHHVATPDEALNMIEALRDTYRGRESVVWQSEEPLPTGSMYGIAPHGVVFVIRVTPLLD